MRNRTLGRELALKYLYSRDITDAWHFDDFLLFSLDQEKSGPARTFGRELLEKLFKRRKAYQRHAEEATDNWTWKRMALVDRNLLLLGIHEILDRPDIPATVTINEIIELAKRFGSATSPAFVNGILDSIRKKQSSPPASTKE